MSTREIIAVRLEADVIARVDALKTSISTPWHDASRSDALRHIILAGLEHLEPAPRPSKRRTSARASAPPSSAKRRSVTTGGARKKPTRRAP